MSPSMRTQCKRCKLALDDEGFAFICSYGYTFCAAGMDHSAPNCGGELVARLERRPKRS